MLYGEHLHAEELPPQCATCDARATVEVFDKQERSHGYFCLHCGKRKVSVLERLEKRWGMDTSQPSRRKT